MYHGFYSTSSGATHYRQNPVPATVNALDIRLRNIIQYANKHDLPRMLDEVISCGATLNPPYWYEGGAIVIAVRAKNYRAISPLMARGALIPQPPHPSNMNLLMEACQEGDIDTARELINVAKIDVQAFDCSGKTALHYAVIAGFEEVATLLLSSGADPDTPACHLSREESQRLFGNSLALHGKPVTPLMLSIQCGHEELTNALLDAGANPNLGALSPLILAAMLDQPIIFNNLLKNNASLVHCRDTEGNDGLYACIASGMKPDYLRSLVDEHDFCCDDGSIHSPLGLAVEKKLHNVCALLLASGAPVEYQDETQEAITIWEEALPRKKFSSAIASLLTATRNASIPQDLPDEIANMLLLFLDNIENPELLSSKGFFTPLLFSSLEKIKNLAQQSNHLTRRQAAMSVACILIGNLTKGKSTVALSNDGEISQVFEWQKKALEDSNRQCDALAAACEKLIADFEQKLQYALTLDFFLECHADCPDQVNIRRFIAARLCETSGMPLSMAKQISDAWNKAAMWTKDWQVAPESEEDGNRFLVALMRNLLRKTIEEPTLTPDLLEFDFRAALDRAIPQETLPLNEFCSNPVQWLRRHEQRTSLADPDDDLPSQLQIALGLPLASCEAMAVAWKLAIRRTRGSAWKTPEELQRVLSKQLAFLLTQWPPDEALGKVLSNVGKLMLENWITRATNPSTARQVSRKRLAVDEAPDAPPTKEARLEETS